MNSKAGLPFAVIVTRAKEAGAARPAASPPPGIEKALTTLYPDSELPFVATADGARISLGYLARNGADLSRPMPSKHRVFAANEAVAAQLVAWAAANDFEVRGPVLVRSHTGEPQQCLDLVRTAVPDPENIEREGRLVLAAVRQTPGSYYQTWCGEIVR